MGESWSTHDRDE